MAIGRTQPHRPYDFRPPPEPRPARRITEAGLQARKDADEQVAHARQALGLRLHDIAATAGQQPYLEVQFGCCFDRTKIGSRANLVRDSAGIARIGLVLTTNGALAGAIDGDARHVDEGKPGLGQHGSSQADDAADHVQSDANRAV